MSNLLERLVQSMSYLRLSRVLFYLAVFLAIIFLFATLAEIAGVNSSDIPDPNRIINLILIDLILLLSLGGLLLRKFLKIFQSFKTAKAGSRLQTKIITMFSLVAICPTILVACFSIFFFNYGMQSWFNQRMDALLEQSVNVANRYIAEHKLLLKITASDTAKNLGPQHRNLLEQPRERFNAVMDAQAELSFLDEVLIFRKSTGDIIARSGENNGLPPPVFDVQMELLDRAKDGEVVEVVTDPYHIRFLARFYDDDYLIIGRSIDPQVLDYLDKTRGAIGNYLKLKQQSSSIQIKFSIAFIIVALLFLFAAIAFGIILSSQIVRPISSLVRATEKVKHGDLTVRVLETEHKDDEIGILSSAFNRMIQQISHQQKDLIIAQRSAAWAEVAKRVAHEIKNPLTPIQLSADRLMSKFKDKSEDPETFARYVNTILRHIDDIRRIVAEFVSSTRLPNPVFEERDIVNLLKELMDARSIINENFEYGFSSNVDHYQFSFDPNQINQVVVNLLKNAEESLEGVKSGKINMDIVVNLQYVTVEIADNGKGFPPELLNRISEPYLTTRTKGTGLGLSIVKKIVNDHAGQLEFLNLPEGGAMIRLIFDVAQLRNREKQ
jgi:two-component system nitrogen regulation sensor histidine kinase NtrY